MITIVDYGMGNLGSISNMFKKIGVRTTIATTSSDLEKSVKILLPGVGSFDSAMERINSMGIKTILDNKVKDEKVPILGICLGMQLLTLGSEEGKLAGLGYVNAHTFKFRFDKEVNLKVPHMGWNSIERSKASLLTQGIDKVSQFGDIPRFYFVHSYFVKVSNEENSILKTTYHTTFDSAIQNDNVYGAQFHPEKSHKFGMKILENFSKI